MKIPLRLLEHRVTITPIKAVGSSVGAKYDTPRTDIPAIVVERIKTVVDMRPSSETKGQPIQANTHVLCRKEQRVEPESLVTVWPGTALERKGTVVAIAYGDHSIAPESVQFWLV